MDLLLLKLALVPFLIGAVTLVGRRYGPRASGLLVGLPLTSGPVVLFQAVEQGREFASRSALGTLTGLVALSGFCLAYSSLAHVQAWRAPWSACALAGWSAYLLAAWLLLGVKLDLVGSTLLVLGTLAAVQMLLPRGGSSRSSAPAPAWDLPFRMVAATAMVLLLTGMADRLGPRLSGLLAPFPIYASVVTISTHLVEKSSSALSVLRGVVLGSYGFALFFIIVSATLVPWGIGPAFSAAAAAAIAPALLHLFVAWARRRRRSDPAAAFVQPPRSR
jgi:hypothetical protein